jgi:hypothetical protein
MAWTGAGAGAEDPQAQYEQALAELEAAIAAKHEELLGLDAEYRRLLTEYQSLFPGSR